MYCSQCGKQLNEGVLFCSECGAKQKNDAEEKVTSLQECEGKRKKGKKLVISILLAFVAWGIVAFVFHYISNAERKFEIGSETSVFYDYYNGAFYNLSGELCKVEELGDRKSSANSSVVAYLEDESKELYCIDAELQPKRVASEVAAYAVSYSGEYIAFIQNIDENEMGSLYIYSVAEKKNTKIDIDVYCNHFCISQDGKAVAYMKNYKAEDDNELYIGGIEIQNQEIDDDGCKPVAVRTGGKEVYYINDNKLYIYDGKSTEKIATNVSDFIGFNMDASEILYVSEGKTYFYNSKMEGPVKVSGKAMSYISAPSKSVYSYNEYGCFWGTDSLKGCILVSVEDDLYWFNQKGTEVIKIASTNYNFQVSENGKSLIYLLGGKLHKIDSLSDEMEEEILYDGDVDRVIASDDLSKIYLSDDEDLYYLKKNGKLEKLTNDFRDEMLGVYWAYNTEMDKLFFVEKDSLMYVGTTEKSKTKVADDIDEVYPCASGVIYYLFDEYNLTVPYYIKNGKSVKLSK